MNIIAVDDERMALELLTRSISTAAPEANITPFRSCEEALEYAGKTDCSIAFLGTR